MYRHLEHRLAQRVLECLQRRYPGVALPGVVVEQPPKVELGDFAIPIFPFAKPLRSAPLKIAETIRAEIGAIDGIAGMQVAPPGYLNVSIDRAWMAAALVADQKPPAEIPPGKILVEHSSINPNKAAHIGHLRNAILGDTFVRLLRYAGREVDIQNYIDNTGVQVADVVVGFTHIEKKSRAEIEALTRQPRFDYYCWDLYAQVSHWYEADKQNLQVRLQTLHAIEDASTETAAVAELISVAVLRRHLETMDRLDIEYDFLPRESEILHLHFWDAAFTKLKESGVLTFESEGKNKGCWVMRRAGTAKANSTTEDTEDTEARQDHRGGPEGDRPFQRDRRLCRQGHCLSHVEVRAAGARFWISQVLSLSERPRLLDFDQRTAKRIILTSATWPKTTTSSTYDSRKRKTQSRKPCAIWVTERLPTISRTSPTGWSC